MRRRPRSFQVLQLQRYHGGLTVVPFSQRTKSGVFIRTGPEGPEIITVACGVRVDHFDLHPWARAPPGYERRRWA